MVSACVDHGDDDDDVDAGDDDYVDV